VQVILDILKPILGIVASLVISHYIGKWLQWLETKKQQATDPVDKAATQAADQKANEESDALKKIDGR
jgi:hypothetical protein